MNTKITSEHLRRRALVYVRQSTTTQLVENLESQRRQYALVDHARELGFQEVAVIDDDLGRSGSGLVERPGFQQLIVAVCAGDVGGVLCIEASRLARNGRDWHHLIELCGLARTLIIDPDGVYDPCLTNDRLLLGMKGTMSEFELSLIRQRSLEAIKAKAGRGELQFALPTGFCWTRAGKIEKEPDDRVRKAIDMIFRKFDELGSIRQVHLWLRQEGVSTPAITYGEFGREIVWKLPVYNTIHGILTNPLYAGTYAYGKSGTRVRVVDGHPRKTQGHAKPREQWMVLLQDHHPGYISWEQFERNQAMISENAHMKSRMSRKSGRGGKSLLAGLFRCRRCGRMLHVTYTGRGRAVRYSCQGALLNHGTKRCISFGGLRPDQMVGHEILRALQAPAIEAAITAAERVARQRSEHLHALDLEIEQSRYEARLAARRYEAVDPDKRLVVSELEARWNTALRRVEELGQRRSQLVTTSAQQQLPNRATLMRLATDLPAVWDSPSTNMRIKQRIIRILVEEIIADVDDTKSEIVLMFHWSGGRHSELRVPKNKTGHHSRETGQDAVDVVRAMAGRWPDEQIAATLNRMGLRTGAGNTWNEARVRSLRAYHKLPVHDPKQDDTSRLTLELAAKHLGVSATLVRRLIRTKVIPATQAVPCAPWEIEKKSLEADAVRQAITKARAPRTRRADTQTLTIPGM